MSLVQWLALPLYVSLHTATISLLSLDNPLQVTLDSFFSCFLTLRSVQYIAPEVFDRRYDKRADIYSFAITMWEMITLKGAYEDEPESRCTWDGGSNVKRCVTCMCMLYDKYLWRNCLHPSMPPNAIPNHVMLFSFWIDVSIILFQEMT